MTLTNPSSGASGGPSSATAPRSQQAQPLKRSVQATFDAVHEGHVPQGAH
ncbi:hypothetical protein GGTG_13208 [Gaeumannomyces tritici R3-111a-1]|uniref:Uncharacterized protein n=1 Tax=Gaeumannomyces tritici (strain R3-111a-1) TaxID=644352 RepID=J3PI80_GAET3|nr:hypothetical protein GGTG_13208 [Gaeumannomyces tritici R3-111a-1]EJT69592.1 hypothetical protein GGTG_13208 [Gaeumannomyces tritici R3-111a-1]